MMPDCASESYDDICDIVAGTIFEHGLTVGYSAPVLLMVSGGSDSTAMCLLASQFCDLGLLDRKSIKVLTVNHGLRGRDSDEDVEFVRNLASLCGFKFETRLIDIPGHASEYGGNYESAGRYLRYQVSGEMLDAMCEGAGVPSEDGRIWVAHTQDDRVETFFMRAIVGTGPGGFSGIKYQNGRVVRPLLEINRQQLRDYVKRTVDQKGWTLDITGHPQTEGGYWREDATNYDGEHGFRAFVRHELVPVAKRRNPNLGTTLSRTIDLLTDENDFIEGEVESLKQRVVRRVDGYLILDLNESGELAVPILRRLLYSICKELLPVGERIERRHIDIMVANASRHGFAIDLPGGVRAQNIYGDLVFSTGYRDSNDVPDESSGLDMELPLGCSIEVDNRWVSLSEVALAEGQDAVEYARKKSNPRTIFIDKDAVISACMEEDSCESWDESCLRITHRRPGDVVCPFGMHGMHKKLSDVFVDAKVPRPLRDSALVVRAGSKIVWVVDAMLDQRFAVKPGSKILRIKVENE